MVNVTNYLKQNLGTIGAGVGGAALGGVLGFAAGSASGRKKRKRSRVKARARRTRSSAYKRVRRTPRTAGKRRDTSHRRIRYTKKGQPYVILGSGKARFIKKTGARRSHRKKGGRY
jgi:hypothetical protein